MEGGVRREREVEMRKAKGEVLLKRRRLTRGWQAMARRALITQKAMGGGEGDAGRGGVEARSAAEKEQESRSEGGERG